MVPGESPLSGLQIVASSLYPHVSESKQALVSVSSSYRDINLSVGAPSILMTSSKLNYLPKISLTNIITIGVEAFIDEFWRHTNI